MKEEKKYSNPSISSGCKFLFVSSYSGRKPGKEATRRRRASKKLSPCLDPRFVGKLRGNSCRHFSAPSSLPLCNCPDDLR